MRMEKAIYDRLTDAGIDVDGALSRVMGNEGLFLRILAKLKKDENFQGLKKPSLKETGRLPLAAPIHSRVYAAMCQPTGCLNCFQNRSGSCVQTDGLRRRSLCQR